MKAITQRLYTKPNTRHFALLGTVVLVGLFVTSKSRAAPPAYPGDDEFETTTTAKPIITSRLLRYPRTSGQSQQYTVLCPLRACLTDQSETDTIIH